MMFLASKPKSCFVITFALKRFYVKIRLSLKRFFMFKLRILYFYVCFVFIYFLCFFSFVFRLTLYCQNLVVRFVICCWFYNSISFTFHKMLRNTTTTTTGGWVPRGSAGGTVFLLIVYDSGVCVSVCVCDLLLTFSFSCHISAQKGTIFDKILMFNSFSVYFFFAFRFAACSDRVCVD